MFSLFKTPAFHDPQIGELRRSRGHWRGFMPIEPGANASLVISGTRSVPDGHLLVLAKQLPTQFVAWKPIIADALFAHLLPYVEALAVGELSPPTDPLVGVSTTEFGLRVAWDEEHTLGARFQSDKFIELCGSILAP